MNDQPPESPRGRRRLREPGPATPPPSRPAPRRAGPHDPHSSGYQELPQPSRRARPEPGYDAPPGGRRRRLEPPGTLPPADDEFDQQAQQAAPARAARARHGLDEGAADGPAPRRRRAAPDPGEPRRRGQGPEAEAPRRRRAAPDPEERGEARRRRPSPEELAEAEAARRHQAMLDLEEAAEARLRGAPDDEGQVPRRPRGASDEVADLARFRAEAAEPPPGRRRAPDPAEAAGSRRRRAAPDPDETGDSRRRRAALDPDAAPDPRRGAPEPPRRPVQPGDRSVGVPEPGAEPPRRRRPPPPPVREEPETDVIPALGPLLPAEPAHEEPEEFFAEDDEYAEYDDYDEYADDYEDYDEAEYEDDYEEEPEKPRKKKGKRALGWVAALVVIVLLAGGAYYGFNKIFGYDDFEGSGDGDVLFQVDDGDSTSAIGAKLATAGVVASGKAFVKAGEDNPKLAKIQHGFYVMKSHMSGAAAVDRILSTGARVGQLEIRPYTQFDDITQPDGKVTPGVYSLMAKASCAQIDGKSTCVSADDLRKAVDAADLKTLGVPDWAIEPANKADRKDRRLEGLIAPGLYDVRPGATAPEIIGQLVRSSAAAILNAGLSPQSTGPEMTPYQTLIIASIIEREAVKADFGKLSRVIYNRLAINMRLQMDSTVNYVLDRPTLLTNEADRIKSGAYNTYKINGLPPTPISVPSADAIQAAVHPTAGDWVYFVKCEKNGLSCFAVTNDEHNRNRDLARERGVI
jgi:uncharacterized YceG family protein